MKRRAKKTRAAWRCLNWRDWNPLAQPKNVSKQEREDENGPGEGPGFRELREKKQVRIFSLMKRLRLFYAGFFNAR
jgi:hypothetical protein